MTERTLALVKPDGVKRQLAGEVLKRIETKGYKIIAVELKTADKQLLDQHYAEHVGKSFYDNLVEYMTSGPVLAIVAEGENVIAGWRTLMGNTKPTEAAPGTVRGDLARDWPGEAVQNIVHGSDSVEAAEKEIKLWFPDFK